MGTAAYMAPEQATGGKVDARSDIFSFGAMLYEMATGTRAFAGASVADTLAAVLRAQPTPPTQIVAALPRELERLILRCLRKEPERRYQTMLDVRNELQEIKEESRLGHARSTAGDAAASASPPHGAAAAVAGGGRRRRSGRVVPPGTARARAAADARRAAHEPEWRRARPALSPDGEQVAFSWDGEKTVTPGRDATPSTSI